MAESSVIYSSGCFQEDRHRLTVIFQVSEKTGRAGAEMNIVERSPHDASIPETIEKWIPELQYDSATGELNYEGLVYCGRFKDNILGWRKFEPSGRCLFDINTKTVIIDDSGLDPVTCEQKEVIFTVK